MPIGAANSYDIGPSIYITTIVELNTYRNRRAIRAKSHGVHIPCTEINNISPAIVIVLIQPHYPSTKAALSMY